MPCTLPKRKRISKLQLLRARVMMNRGKTSSLTIIGACGVADVVYVCVSVPKI